MTYFENAYFTGETKITEKQRKSINSFTGMKKPKKSGVWGTGGYSQNKDKFWCPILNDYFFANRRRKHCPLCYDSYRKEDKHEVIKFEERKV